VQTATIENLLETGVPVLRLMPNVPVRVNAGALVYALGLPYGWTHNGPEVVTDTTGWATITMSPTANMPLRNGALVVFVRARKAGDNLLAGVSTRKFAGVGEPVGSGVEVSSSSTSKTSVSDMFIERTRTALSDLMSRRLEDVRLAVMMLDGIEIADRTHVVALGITTEGVKIPLGLWEGSTENATLARALLADLVDRGLDPEQAILFVIDGGKALRRAIKDVFGVNALVHRCHRHKERNVTDLLPERDRPTVRARMRAAWALSDPELARQRLELLASELERSWPDAAGSLREGMADTLTLMRLGITGQLARTMSSTNPCESMIEIVRHTQRNVKRWQDGDMRKRWTAAGMLIAEQQFRRIIGYRDLAKLVIAIERHAIHITPENHDRQEIPEPVTV